MAREEIPEASQWSLSPGPLNTCLISFELPDGTIKGPWATEYINDPAPNHFQQITEANRQNRERQMNKQPSPGMPSFPGQSRRFYMAGMGRFLTHVREAEWTGGEHPYSNALNNPVQYTDASGLQASLPKVCRDKSLARGACDLGQEEMCQLMCKKDYKTVWFGCYTIPSCRAVCCLCNPCDTFGGTTSGVNEALKECTRPGEKAVRSNKETATQCRGDHYTYRMQPSKRLVTVLCCECLNNDGVGQTKCRCKNHKRTK